MKIHKAFQGMWKYERDKYWKGTPICRYTLNNQTVSKTWPPVTCKHCLAKRK